MAKQKGPLKVKGTIGDLSFYKSADGYLLREKGGISKERIRTDPAFERTRENGSEFGRAGSATKTFKNAFAPLIGKSRDRLMGSRLHRLMVRIQRTDETERRGFRTVTNGDLGLLDKFEFNARSGFDRTLYEDTEVSVDRVTGECTAEIPEFLPSTQLMAPPGATHFQFSIAAAEVDFENASHRVVMEKTAALVYDQDTLIAPQTLSVSLPAASVLPIFVVLKVSYFLESGGIMYPMKNGTYNAATVFKVDLP